MDKYQGQQNDFVLLSLVRTRAIGHIRDIRRLIVAASRARLGWYVFGAASLFQDCYEMQPVFRQWSERPFQLALVKGEAYGRCTRTIHDAADVTSIPGLQEMDVLVRQMTTEWEAHASATDNPDTAMDEQSE